jgi:anti-sigma B factor antagonist
MWFEAEAIGHPGHRVLVLSGDIDVTSAPTLDAEFFCLIEESALPLIVDMAAVRLCAAAGLHSIVRALRHARMRECPLVFSGITPQVRKVIGIAGLHRVVTEYPTVADARRDLIS